MKVELESRKLRIEKLGRKSLLMKFVGKSSSCTELSCKFCSSPQHSMTFWNSQAVMFVFVISSSCTFLAMSRSVLKKNVVSLVGDVLRLTLIASCKCASLMRSYRLPCVAFANITESLFTFSIFSRVKSSVSLKRDISR